MSEDTKNVGLEQVKIGEQLNALRKKNNWTLDEVSKMTGVGISTLSKLEKNQTNLSFDTWLKLSKGLGLSFQQLVNPEANRVARGCRAMTLDGQGVTFSTKQYDYVVHSTDLLARRMIPLVMRIKTKSPADIKAFSTHAGEEFVLCLEGTVEVHTEYYAPFRLKKGESTYFDATMKHAFVSIGRQDAMILSIVSGTDTDLQEFEDTMQMAISSATA